MTAWYWLPRALQIIIDDVGWWNGVNDVHRNGPYRTAIPRNHVPADYQAIVDLGRALRMKPLCAFILCEWDKENILRGCPTATWMGEDWTNLWPVEPMEEAVDILLRGNKHLEIGLHGVGHEYWHRDTGIGERAEFGGPDDGAMRPADDIRRHLDYFGKLLNMWKLGSFPTAMFPPAARYRYAPSQNGAGKIFAEYGMHYVTQPLHGTDWHEPPIAATFGVEHGMLVTDRSNDMFDYDVLDTSGHMGRLHRIWNNSVGMHWPNILSIDPARNGEVVSRWVDALKTVEDEPDLCLGCDTAHAMSQEPYRLLTDVFQEEQRIYFDFRKVDALPTRYIVDEFYFKTAIPFRTGEHHNLYIPEPVIQGNHPFYLYSIRRTGVGIGTLELPSILCDG